MTKQPAFRTNQPLTTAATRLLCVIGHPVAHSKSPQIHDAALRELYTTKANAIDARYLAFDIHPDNIFTALNGLVALGFLGCNATIPHKQAIYDFADVKTTQAQGVGVANTLYWNETNQLVAENTDVTALGVVLAQDCQVTADTHVHIFGAGGAAKATAVAAGQLGAVVTVFARRPEQAQMVQQLALHHGGKAPKNLQGQAKPDVTINATPLGRQGETVPDPLLQETAKGQVALDLNYEYSPFLEQAKQRGATVFDGRNMLIIQAEHAFKCWTKSVPHSGLMANVWHNLG